MKGGGWNFKEDLKTVKTMILKVSGIRIFSLIPVPYDDNWVLLMEAES